MKKKLAKGTWGYLDRNKVNAWKLAVILLSVPIAIFLFAWITSGTRNNLITVVSIVGCLPGCNQTVHAILASRYHSISRELYQETEEARGTLPVLYESVFTTYERTFYVDCLVLSGRDLVGYSGDEKTDPSKAAEYLQESLQKNSYRQSVRITRDKKAFLGRVRSLAEKGADEVSFQEDERYPGFTRDEVVLQLLKAISL